MSWNSSQDVPQDIVLVYKQICAGFLSVRAKGIYCAAHIVACHGGIEAVCSCVCVCWCVCECVCAGKDVGECSL